MFMSQKVFHIHQITRLAPISNNWTYNLLFTLYKSMLKTSCNTSVEGIKWYLTITLHFVGEKNEN